MKRIFILVFLLCQCGLEPLQTDELPSQNFYVLQVTPTQWQEGEDLNPIEVSFSQRIDPETVQDHVVALVPQSEVLEDWNALQSNIEDGESDNYVSKINLDESGQKLIVTISPHLPVDVSYQFLVFPLLRSSLHFPLDQRGIGTDSEMFAIEFKVLKNRIQISENIEGSEVDDGVEYPDIASPADSVDSEVPVVFDWNRVLFTEVVTDPQQDHGESEGGNGVLFDHSPGTGSVSTSDEYLEIFNGTNQTLDVSQWVVKMNDGTDVEMTLDNEAWDFYFSAGGAPTSFLPGEFLLLGNPEGQMNNTLSVELWDDLGELRDRVEVEDANATDLSDEAYVIGPNGNWSQSASSLGGFNDTFELIP